MLVCMFEDIFIQKILVAIFDWVKELVLINTVSEHRVAFRLGLELCFSDIVDSFSLPFSSNAGL